MTMHMENARRAFSTLPAPRYWAQMICAPVARMPLNAVARLMTGVTSPYAAMLSGPRNLPMTIPSMTIPTMVATAAAMMLMTDLRKRRLMI